MEKTETKKDTLNRLFLENGLLKEDVYQHKHYTIITRSGIEKIQYKNDIEVRFKGITMTPELCVVKAFASIKKQGQHQKHIETFGSAGHNGDGKVQKGKEFQYTYYPEIAEKRALSRAILKITDFYKYGVFGEDENPEFQEKTGEALETQNKPQQQAQAPQVTQGKAEGEKAPQAAPNAPTIIQAVQEMRAVKGRQDMAKVWNKYTTLHTDKAFLEAMKEAGEKYPKGKELSHAS